MTTLAGVLGGRGQGVTTVEIRQSIATISILPELMFLFIYYIFPHTWIMISSRGKRRFLGTWDDKGGVFFQPPRTFYHVEVSCVRRYRHVSMAREHRTITRFYTRCYMCVQRSPTDGRVQRPHFSRHQIHPYLNITNPLATAHDNECPLFINENRYPFATSCPLGDPSTALPVTFVAEAPSNRTSDHAIILDRGARHTHTYIKSARRPIRKRRRNR